MKLHRLLGAAALTLASCLAQAAPVTFNFESTITLNAPGSGGGFDPARALGNPLSISVTFDSAAPLIQTRNDGHGNPTVFDLNPSSISFSISGGGVTEGMAFSASGGGLLRVRDSAWNPDCGSGNLFTDFCEIVDGLTLQIFSADGLTQWSLILRGTTLDLITGAAAPTFQDDRWDNQQIAQFTICQTSANANVACDLGELDASITAVPEPSTLALAGLALIAAAVRRRAGARG
jgi:hypothetical protein